MAIASPPAVPVRPSVAPLRLWQAPLVPVALALTTGIVLDRVRPIPLPVALAAALAGLLAFVLHGSGRHRPLGLCYLWAGVLGFGAALHHWHQGRGEGDGVRQLAGDEPQPARLRGVIESAPLVTRAGPA